MELNSIIEQLSSILEIKEKPFTLLEAAAFLNVSASYLYKLTHQKKIPYFKPQGKKIYFLRSDLMNYLLQNRNKTVNEIEQEASNFLLRKKRGK